MKLWRRSAFVTLVVLAGCSSSPDPLGIAVRRPRALWLSTECAVDVRAKVAESPREVRIHGVRARWRSVGDDCLSVVELRLQAPIGDRKVVVGGDEWVRAPEGCPYGDYVPPGSDVAGCALNE